MYKVTQHIQRIHWISLAVEDQIVRIQIDTQIARSNCFKATKHRRGCLLPGFKQQPLIIFFQMLRHLPHCIAKRLEVRIIRSSGIKPMWSQRP